MAIVVFEERSIGCEPVRHEFEFSTAEFVPQVVNSRQEEVCSALFILRGVQGWTDVAPAGLWVCIDGDCWPVRGSITTHSGGVLKVPVPKDAERTAQQV
jgi:hypothetical protein